MKSIAYTEHTKQKEGRSLWRKIVYLGVISNFVTKPSKGEISPAYKIYL